jgi:Uma2 family endonuclease
MATNPVKRKWTLEEYLAYEQETGIKHEYLDGEIYAMSGGTDKHSLIKFNLGVELGQQLKKSKTCRGYDSDMRVKITDTKYVYPDLTVVCGEARFSDEEHTMLLNPTLVVEVMSATSENYDKGQKADFYQGISSVQSYLLLDQNKAHAQLHTRHESAWLKRTFSGLDAVVPLESIGCTLALSEAYRNVEFEEK